MSVKKREVERDRDRDRDRQTDRDADKEGKIDQYLQPVARFVEGSKLVLRRQSR